MRARYRQSKALIVATVLVLLFAGASACGDHAQAQVLTEHETGTDVRLGAAEQFEVRLESTPGTGYTWEISAMTSPDLVELERRSHVDADSGLVGAAGIDVFVFRVVDGGAGVLRLEYIRRFDDPIVPERVVEFIIRIEGADLPSPPGTPPPLNTAVAPG